MVDVAYAAGFGSVRRFNALFAARYGMAPTAIRRAIKNEKLVHDGLTLRLAYRPPFAWREILNYLAGRAIPGVEAADRTGLSGAYLRSVRIEGIAGWLRVTHLDAKRQLELEVAPALAPVLMPLLARVRNQFDLDANPTVIEAHLLQDALLAKQIRLVPGLRVPGTFDAFELAVRAVLGQQVSVAGATTLSGRLVTRFGEPCESPFDAITHHFPAAAHLAAVPVADIAQIGLPKTRAQTIQNLAQFAERDGLNLPPGATLDAAVAHLKTVAGIGDWTAHYIALRALRFPDAFPAGDLGLQKAAATDMPDMLPAARLTEKQLNARGATWSPWRGYAALMLWQSLA
jgi:AraC family transcriptional regulator of adaptative response / DNA-3-methyladenine glycosylase II